MVWDGCCCLVHVLASWAHNCPNGRPSFPSSYNNPPPHLCKEYGGANEITNGLEGAILSQGKTELGLAEQSHVIQMSESWLARPLVALWLHILKQQVISCSLPFSVPRRWLLTVITSLSLANRSSPHACLSCRQRWKQKRRCKGMMG